MVHLVVYVSITGFVSGPLNESKTLVVLGLFHAQFALLILLSRVPVQQPSRMMVLIRFALPFFGLILCWYGVGKWFLFARQSASHTGWTMAMFVQLIATIAMTRWLGTRFNFYSVQGSLGSGITLSGLLRWVTVCAAAFAFWSMGFRYELFTAIDTNWIFNLLFVFIGLVNALIAIGCWMVRHVENRKTQATFLVIVVMGCWVLNWVFCQLLIAMMGSVRLPPLTMFIVSAAVILATLFALPKEFLKPAGC